MENKLAYAVTDMLNELHDMLEELAEDSFAYGYEEGFNRGHIDIRECEDIGEPIHLTFKCSACKESWHTPHSPFFKFCPSCGAEIKRKETKQ